MDTLLPKAKVTPVGKPETDADIDPAQIGVAVYFISVIAVVPVTACELEPLVSATVNSFPQSGLLASVRGAAGEKSEAAPCNRRAANSPGSEGIADTHQPDKS